jgi:hypothetical protein
MQTYVRLRKPELERSLKSEQTQCEHIHIGLAVPGLSFVDAEGGHFRVFCVQCDETLGEEAMYE